MKSLGSLIRCGKYSPNYEERFYLFENTNPGLVCQGRGFGSFDVEYYWNLKSPDLNKYYLHPYFPDKVIDQVVLLQDIPGSKGKHGSVIEVHNDLFVLYATDDKDSKWITYTKDWIYQYPTYFKPIYL